MFRRLKRLYASRARTSSDDVLLAMCGEIQAPAGAAYVRESPRRDAGPAAKIQERGARRCFGLDGYLPAAREAVENGVRVGIADFEGGFPFTDAAFDIIILNQVIEHIRNLDVFVAELARILKPGGHLLLATPNLASWTNIAALICQQQAFSQSISSRFYLGNRFARAYRQPVPYSFPQHCHILTSRGIEDLLGVNGLRLCRLRGAGYFPLPDLPMARIDPGHAQYLIAHAKRDG